MNLQLEATIAVAMARDTSSSNQAYPYGQHSSANGGGDAGHFYGYQETSGPGSEQSRLPAGAALPYAGVRTSSPMEESQSRETDRRSSSYPRSDDGRASMRMSTGKYAQSEALLLPAQPQHFRDGYRHPPDASDKMTHQKTEAAYAPPHSNVSTHHPAGAAPTKALDNEPRNTTIASILVGYGTPHQLGYLVTVLLQTVACTIMIGIVWAKYRDGTPKFFQQLSDQNEENLRRRSITVYLAIFLFGSAFEIVTALDALRLNNTIQLIGVCMFTIAMIVRAVRPFSMPAKLTGIFPADLCSSSRWPNSECHLTC